MKRWIRFWFFRLTRQRRRAGAMVAAQTRRENRKSRFAERSRSLAEPPSVVICDEVAK